MQKQSNIRILEILKYLYLRTDEDHPATVADIMEHLKGKGISTVRQTVYGDLEDLIAAGIDVVVTKSTQNQYFIQVYGRNQNPCAKGMCGRNETNLPPVSLRAG